MFSTKQKQIQQCSRLLLLLTLIFLFNACGGSGGGSLPPEIPKGIAAGNAVDALIVDGTLTAYSWAGGVQGEKLGQTVTDETGGYSLELQTEDTPILLVLEGGWYKEESSGVRVSLRDGQQLYAVTYYEKGDAVNIMVTPMTSLAYGLTQYYINEKGENVQNAITKANSGISALFNFDILTICPANITDGTNSSPIVTDELMAGFYCAAFSSWTEQLSTANGLDVHSFYNSIYLSQTMYNDIVYDGQLNGVGWSSSGLTVVPLNIGTTALDSQVYRKMIGWNIIQAVNSDYNKTALDINDLIGTVEQFSQQINGLFANEQPLPLDIEGPAIEHLPSTGTIYAKVANFTFTVNDECGVKYVSVDFKGEISTVSPGDDGTYNYSINTQYYDDGEHTLTITATDNLDNVTTENHVIIINNSGVGIGVTSSNRTNESEFMLTGYYVDGGTNVVSIIVRDNTGTVTADLDEETYTWSAEVRLDSGLNSLLIESTDDVGTKTTLGVDIGLDQNAPIILTGPHSNAIFKTDTGIFTSQLEDSNNDYSVYIVLENASLNGLSPSDVLGLDDAGIPYFRFSVEDPNADDGVSTPDNELLTTMDFSIGSTELVTERVLTPATNSNNFVIPLTVETLHEDWDNSNDGKGHIITVHCTDNAGNTVTKKYEFTVYFQTPVISVRSLNNSADVVLYAYDTGSMGGIIQTARTDSDGTVSINVISPPRPVLARITGGNYYEMGTGNRVSIPDNQHLDCLFIYIGDDMNITISPLTHVAAALAMNKIAGGEDIEPAIREANTTISYIYGVDIIGSYPVDISDVSNATTIPNDNYEYGFLLAGISKWTDDAAHINGATNQAVYNSLLLADRMANDIYLDGVLDGDYAFGAVSLGPAVYRNGFAYGILDVVQSEDNVTSLDENDILDFMVDVAENGDTVYGSEPITLFDKEGPIVQANSFTTGDYFGDDAELYFTVTDMTGVDSAGLYINNTLVTIAIDPNNPTFTIDTTDYPDGLFGFEVWATDIQGNTSVTAFTINIDNTPPVLNITSNSVTNDTSFTVTGSVSDSGAGVALLTIDGQHVDTQADGTFNKGVSLSESDGRNLLSYIITDNKGKSFTGSFYIDVDKQPSMIEASPDYNSSGRFYSAPHTVYTADISQNNTTPFYVEYWKTSLHGTPIDKNDLDDAGYMYFFVRFWDIDSGNGVTTPATDLVIEQQYLQGATVIDDWHEIPDQVWSYSLMGNVTIPITDEIINPSWKTVGAGVQQTIKIRATDKAGNQSVKTFTFYALVEPFEITTQTINQTNVKGAPYSQSFSAAGGIQPYHWSIYSGQAPCDLSLSTTGVLSGDGSTTYCSNGTYTFVVRVEDANGVYFDKTFSITLISPITIQTASLGSFLNNVASSSQTISAIGGYGSGYDFSIVSGALPTGYSFNTNTGVISGITYLSWGGESRSITIRATDKINSSVYTDKTFTLNIDADVRSASVDWADLTGSGFFYNTANTLTMVLFDDLNIPVSQYTSYNGWSYRSIGNPIPITFNNTCYDIERIKVN